MITTYSFQSFLFIKVFSPFQTSHKCTPTENIYLTNLCTQKE